MKKSEKLITAILTIAIGVLLIVMQDNFIGVLMTIAGVALIALGLIDLFSQAVPPAVIKIVVGVLIIVCGWVLVEAVLYVIAAVLLISGILLLYDKFKKKVCCDTLLFTLLEYATPVALILLGALFLFHQTLAIELVFILSGILAIIEGGVLLINAFQEN